MGTFQHKVLMIFLSLFFLTNIYSESPDSFTGIWRGQHTSDPQDDSFIAITKLTENNYFVLFVKSFGGHSLDYATYGELNEDGYIVVNAHDSVFFLILKQSGYLYHLWTLDDPSPTKYKKILTKEEGKKEKLMLPSSHDWQEFLDAQSNIAY